MTVQKFGEFDSSWLILFQFVPVITFFTANQQCLSTSVIMQQKNEGNYDMESKIE